MFGGMHAALWLLLVSVSILDMKPEQQMVDDINISVCRVRGGSAANTTILNLWRSSQKRRPIILGFHMTSEKHTLEIFSWRVLLSRMFKKQENKRRIRESESVETGQVLAFPFSTRRCFGRNVSSSPSHPRQSPCDARAHGSHLSSGSDLNVYNKLWPDRLEEMLS